MIWYILLIWNVFVMLVYGIDKGKAMAGAFRISEAALISLAYIFGSVGAMFGMILFNHKTSKIKFRLLVPLAVLLHAVIAIIIYKYVI